jgi:uncharacterized protein YndB with AHSA1/START domain
MPTVTVERTINAPIEGVFDALTDHANYDSFRSVRSSELIREGSPDRNGVGAFRRVVVGPLHFGEEITAYERPERMDYVIREINAPLEHEGGSIRCAPAGEGTHVVWTSTFGVPLRVVGGVAGWASAPMLRVGFASILRDVAKRLER